MIFLRNTKKLKNTLVAFHMRSEHHSRYWLHLGKAYTKTRVCIHPRLAVFQSHKICVPCTVGQASGLDFSRKNQTSCMKRKSIKTAIKVYVRRYLSSDKLALSPSAWVCVCARYGSAEYSFCNHPWAQFYSNHSVSFNR